MATINYVKFLRGTPTAYSNLATKDPNTLYFISATNATTGKLYLGDKEITTSGSGGSGGATTLSELTDVVISTVANKQVLIYNSSTAKWENGFVSDIIDTIIDSNVLVKKDGVYTLLGFDDADSGAVAQKGSDGKLKWVALTESYTKAEIDSMLAGRLKRKKVSALSDIDTSADDAELYIYLVPATSATTNNAYDEYVVVDGSIELLNSAPADLSDYVKTEDLDDYAKTSDLANFLTADDLTDYAKASDLSSYVLASTYTSEIGSISDLVKDSGVTTIIGQVNALGARLTWTDM